MKGPQTTPNTRNQKELQHPNSSPRKGLALVFVVFQKQFSLRVVRVIRGQPSPVSRVILKRRM